MVTNDNERKHEKTNYSFYLECMAYFAAAAVVAATIIALVAANASSGVGFAATHAAVAGVGGALAGLILFAALITLACLFARPTDIDNRVLITPYSTAGYSPFGANRFFSTSNPSMYPYGLGYGNVHAHQHGGSSGPGNVHVNPHGGGSGSGNIHVNPHGGGPGSGNIHVNPHGGSSGPGNVHVNPHGGGHGTSW